MSGIRRRLYEEERGIALVTAMMMTMVVLTLSVVMVNLAIHNSTSSAQDRARVQAVHAAEAGIDVVYSQMRQYGYASLPCLQDNDLATWRAWGNEYWPAEYLIDARGHVRESHFGEGSYGQTERDIRALLAEAGHARVGAMARVGPVLRPSAVATPETYLGTMRAQGFPPGGRPSDGTRAYPAAPPNLPVNDFWLSGTWRVTPEAAMARRGARIDAEVVARHVYLVLSGRGTVRVSLDGRPRAPVRVDGQRLYELVRPPDLQPHRLTLRLDPGLAGFAFTFG